MKYIVMQRQIGDNIQEIPIMFPSCIVHKHMALALLRLVGNPYNFINKVASAGEISVGHDGGYHCFGHSETLNINSRGPEDEILFAACEYGAGFK